MLLKTKARLALFDNTQLDMHLFIEKGIRGGISMISHRHAKANNKYMKSYDSDEKSSYIMYLDANNLYGYAMIQSLPYDDFKWIKPDNFDEERIMSIKEDAEKGYIFQVDLEYPEELHDLHDGYPLAPEPMIVTDNMLSSYSHDVKKRLNLGSGKVPKLVCTLNDKKKYVVHYRNLQQYLSLGMKLTKVHKVLRFNQKPFLKDYIDFNTNKRANAKNDFEKDLYKLANNAVFGKTMENVRSRINFQLVVNNEKGKQRLKTLIAKPTYKLNVQFNDNIIGVEMNKTTVTLDKPIAIGFSILDLSKTLMYDFHYNTIKKKYGSKATLLFTDTDSLTYHIQTKDVYKDMEKMKEQFDFSDYPKDHFLYDDTNKKVIGKFKCETSGVPITEFVGLKSKLYSFTTEKGESKKAKGVSKSVVKNVIKFSDYKQCIEDDSHTLSVKINSIRSYKHKIYSILQNKVALSSFDDKKYYLNSVDSLSYGHYKTKQ